MEGTFELKILTNLENLPKVVETNIDEVQPVIKAAIERTKGLVVTDNKDEILAADADAAKLRKMSDAIKRFRLDHIKLWKQPMEDFETKCKKAEKELETAADNISNTTGEVKELWRQRKREKCTALWSEKLQAAFDGESDVIESAGAKAFFDHWCDPHTKGTWVNSSVKESAIGSAMDAEIERMKSTLEGVAQNYANESEEVKAKARMAALGKFDMNDVIFAVNAYKKEQAEIAARAEEERKRQAEKDAAMEAQKRALAAKRTAGGQGSPAPAVKPVAAPAEKPVTAKATGDGEKMVCHLEITGTFDNLLKLRDYGKSLGITFKDMDKKEE